MVARGDKNGVSAVAEEAIAFLQLARHRSYTCNNSGLKVGTAIWDRSANWLEYFLLALFFTRPMRQKHCRYYTHED